MVVLYRDRSFSHGMRGSMWNCIETIQTHKGFYLYFERLSGVQRQKFYSQQQYTGGSFSSNIYR